MWKKGELELGVTASKCHLHKPTNSTSHKWSLTQSAVITYCILFNFYFCGLTKKIGNCYGSVRIFPQTWQRGTKISKLWRTNKYNSFRLCLPGHSLCECATPTCAQGQIINTRFIGHFSVTPKEWWKPAYRGFIGVNLKRNFHLRGALWSYFEVKARILWRNVPWKRWNMAKEHSLLIGFQPTCENPQTELFVFGLTYIKNYKKYYIKVLFWVCCFPENASYISEIIGFIEDLFC